MSTTDYQFVHWSRRVSLAAVLSLIPVVVVHMTLIPRWQTNDDFGADLLLRGVAVMRQSSAFTFFSNILLTLPIQQLYAIAPQIPWYYATHCFLHYLASLVIALTCLSGRHGRGHLVLLFYFFFVVDAYYYAYPQFTVTSLLLANAGCLAWIRGSDSVPGGRIVWLTVVSTLLTLSAMVRLDSALMTIVVSFPIWLFNVRRSAGAVSENPAPNFTQTGFLTVVLPSLAVLVMGLTLIAVVEVISRTVYASQSGYQSFREFNELRVRFNDYGLFNYDQQTQPVYDAAGWSENDYAMLMDWVFIDDKVYSTNTLRQIASSFGPLGSSIHPPSFLKLLVFFWFSAFQRFGVFICAAALILGHRKRTEWWLMGIATVVLFSVWVVLLTFLKLPLRVLDPSFVLLPTLALSGTEQPSPAAFGIRRRVFFNYLWVACVVGLTVHAVDFYGLIVQHYRSIEKTSRQVESALQSLHRLNGRAIVVVGIAIPIEFLPAGTVSHLPGLDLVWLGALSRSPLMTQRLREVEIDDIYSALYEKRDVYLMCAPHLAPEFVTFIREHRGAEVDYELMRSFSFSEVPVGVYRFQRTAKPRVRLSH